LTESLEWYTDLSCACCRLLDGLVGFVGSYLKFRARDVRSATKRPTANPWVMAACTVYRDKDADALLTLHVAANSEDVTANAKVLATYTAWIHRTAE